jgi:ketosteroid isomerase-like protein
MANLHKVEAALARGDTAEQVARSLYADNVLMVGEGETGSSRGMDVAIKDVQGWMDSLGPNGGKGCKYSIPDPVVASEKTFTSFVLLVCKANPPVLPEDQQLRMVYSWEKRSDGWRVVLEMWALGVM